jgi:hypothetical protein
VTLDSVPGLPNNHLKSLPLKASIKSTGQDQQRFCHSPETTRRHSHILPVWCSAATLSLFQCMQSVSSGFVTRFHCVRKEIIKISQTSLTKIQGPGPGYQQPYPGPFPTAFPKGLPSSRPTTGPSHSLRPSIPGRIIRHLSIPKNSSFPIPQGVAPWFVDWTP